MVYIAHPLIDGGDSKDIVLLVLSFWGYEVFFIQRPQELGRQLGKSS